MTHHDEIRAARLETAIMLAMQCRPQGVMTGGIDCLLRQEHDIIPRDGEVLRRLKGLERRNMVQRVRSAYAVHLCWALPA